MQPQKEMMLSNYTSHKLVTKFFEWGLVGLLSVQAMETARLWISIISGSLAIIAGAMLLIRTYWEIKVKRREHEIKQLEKQHRDQEFWDEREKQNKK